jgi:hypothetical protein
MLDWGVPFSEDDYIPEFLINTFPSKCFFVDSLPATVHKENSSKFDQVEKILYNVLKDKIDKILIILWLYNDVYLKSELLTQNLEIKNAHKLSPILLLEYEKLKQNSNGAELVKIVDLTQLNAVLELSNSEVIDSLMIFEQYQSIVISSWSCYFIYIHDLSKLEIIEKIVNVVGLYLRRHGS